MEIDEGILIPGHRFLPFYDSQLHPKQIVLHTQKGKLRRKRISWSLQRLAFYYSLFGNKSFIELLVSETEENARLFLNDE